MKVFIIDDQTAIIESLSMIFSEKGDEVSAAEYGKEALEKVREEPPDLILLDIRLPDINGLEVLKEIRSMNNHVFVIIMTAFHDMETTIEAMQCGAYDYIHKPINIKELNASVDKVREALGFRTNFTSCFNDQGIQYHLDTIVGESKPMQEIFKLIGLISSNRATTLIQGESGTGKELIARSIHNNSVFKNQPFVSINCSALVDTLFESEVFGHEKGAFTNALNKKKGQFELAENGTIFLDEVSELPLNAQAKLLRFLQEKEFQRVGGVETITSKARVIAATNRNLSEMVNKGLFREDLFFRLKVITFNLPPLRERRTDIQLLTDFFLHKISRDVHKPVSHISEKAMNLLLEYRWPGNVRELQNVLTRAIIICRENVIMKHHLSIISDLDGMLISKEGFPLIPLAEMEKRYITKVLDEVHGNRGKACEILKISKPTLRKKMKNVVLGEN